MVDAEFAFEAVAGGFLAGEFEDEGVDVEVYFFDIFGFYAFSVELGTAVYDGVDDYAAGVGFEGVLFGFPCAGFVIILFG